MAHRTQLYLDDAQYDYLKHLAEVEKKSIAQIIREWIEEKKDGREIKRFHADSFMKTRGLFDSGAPDMAAHFDEYLYGNPATDKRS